jgi:hypothetical protein
VELGAGREGGPKPVDLGVAGDDGLAVGIVPGDHAAYSHGRAS